MLLICQHVDLKREKKKYNQRMVKERNKEIVNLSSSRKTSDWGTCKIYSCQNPLETRDLSEQLELTFALLTLMLPG